MLNLVKSLHNLSPTESSPNLFNKSVKIEIDHYRDHRRGIAHNRFKLNVPAILVILVVLALLCACGIVVITPPSSQSDPIIPFSDSPVIIDETQTTQAIQYITATGDVNVREFPNIHSGILTLIPAGSTAAYKDRIQTDSRGVDWYYIEIKNEQIKGWVSSKYAVLNSRIYKW